MFDPLLTGGSFPFTLSLALLFGLLALELVFAILGGTLLGAGGDAPDGPDIDGPEIDMPDIDDPGMTAPEIAEFDLDLELDGLDLDAGDFDGPEFDGPDGAQTELPDGAGATGGIAGWLGFGTMPAMIWLASILLSFGVTGLVIQNLLRSALGFELPATLAAIPALIAALWFTRRFGGLFARLLPKTETSALSERHLGRRPGVITQGTASRGKPAEVRVTDRYGNTHYLRAEPLRDDISIPQGAEVIVLRHRRDGGYLLVPLNT